MVRNERRERKRVEKCIAKARKLRTTYMSLWQEMRYVEAIPLARKVLTVLENELDSDDPNIAFALNDLASLLHSIDDFDAAEPLLHRAKSILEKAQPPHPLVLATVHINLGKIIGAKGDYAEGESLFLRGLPVYEKAYGLTDPRVVQVRNVLQHLDSMREEKQKLDAETWNLIQNYKALFQNNQCNEAIICARELLAILEEKRGVDHVSVVIALNDLAAMFVKIDDSTAAKPLLLRALAILEKGRAPNLELLADVLSNLGIMYGKLGDYASAETSFRRVLAVLEDINGEDDVRVAVTLNSLANLLEATGDYTSAESFYLQALTIRIDKLGGEDPSVADIFNNLGDLHEKIGNPSAELFYGQSLGILLKSLGPDHLDTSYPLNNLGNNLVRAERYNEAEACLRQALAIKENIQGINHVETRITLSNLANLLREKGEYAESEILCLRSIFNSEKNPTLNIDCLNQYSRLLYDTSRPMAAICYIKKIVNILQEKRGNIALIGKERLANFDVVIEEVYEHLSDLLADQGRIPEAEYVLDLLKEQEYFMTVRSLGAAPGSYLKFTDDEKLVFDHVDQCLPKISALYERRRELEKIVSRTLVQERELNELQDKANDCVKILKQTLAKIEQQSISTRPEDNKMQSFMPSPQTIGDGTAVIRTLAAKEKFHVFLHRSGISRHFTDADNSIGSKKFNAKILEFRRVLQPDRDGILFNPRPLATELYNLILRPIEDELRDNPNILWALQGALRYIPMAALHDGVEYLVKRFPSTTLIPYAMDNRKETPESGWRGVGIGVSAGGEGFEPLPAVTKEINGIIRDQHSTEGVMEGVRLLDDRAQWEQVCDTLASSHFDAIHIASHFKLDPFQIDTSQLLLGKGELKSLREMKLESKIFNGVELLALSACDTACDAPNVRGKEVDSLAGYALKEGGAKAVLASLWKVNDNSTSLLMQEFYRLLQCPGLSKAKALQQAQLFLMNRDRVPSDEEEVSRSQVLTRYRFEYDEDQPYAHPYFWAPFILMGNWR